MDKEAKVVAKRLKAACDQGRVVGNLTAGMILHWQQQGWYDLFNEQ